MGSGLISMVILSMDINRGIRGVEVRGWSSAEYPFEKMMIKEDMLFKDVLTI